MLPKGALMLAPSLGPKNIQKPWLNEGDKVWRIRHRRRKPFLPSSWVKQLHHCGHQIVAKKHRLMDPSYTHPRQIKQQTGDINWGFLRSGDLYKKLWDYWTPGSVCSVWTWGYPKNWRLQKGEPKHMLVYNQMELVRYTVYQSWTQVHLSPWKATPIATGLNIFTPSKNTRWSGL